MTSREGSRFGDFTSRNTFPPPNATQNTVLAPRSFPRPIVEGFKNSASLNLGVRGTCLGKPLRTAPSSDENQGLASRVLETNTLWTLITSLTLESSRVSLVRPYLGPLIYRPESIPPTRLTSLEDSPECLGETPWCPLSWFLYWTLRLTPSIGWPAMRSTFAVSHRWIPKEPGQGSSDRDRPFRRRSRHASS